MIQLLVCLDAVRLQQVDQYRGGEIREHRLWTVYSDGTVQVSDAYQLTDVDNLIIGELQRFLTDEDDGLAFPSWVLYSTHAASLTVNLLRYSGTGDDRALIITYQSIADYEQSWVMPPIIYLSNRNASDS